MRNTRPSPSPTARTEPSGEKPRAVTSPGTSSERSLLDVANVDELQTAGGSNVETANVWPSPEMAPVMIPAPTFTSVPGRAASVAAS